MEAKDKTELDCTPYIESQPMYIPPPMTMERYAYMQGVDLGVIENQVRKGIIPSIKTGRWRLINTFAIARRCLEPNPTFKAKAKTSAK